MARISHLCRSMQHLILSGTNHWQIQVQKFVPKSQLYSLISSKFTECCTLRPVNRSAFIQHCTDLNVVQSQTWKVSPATSNSTIKDPNVSSLIYDCPTHIKFLKFSLPYTHNVCTIKEDPIISLNHWIFEQTAPKEMKNILKIRRRKMNRHLLKKFRKRMMYTHRKELHQRNKKKEKAFQAFLDSKIKTVNAFDAEEFVKEQLYLARKGGFKIDIFSK